MATLEILTEPIGSIFVSTVGKDDPEDKNDFRVFIIGNENMTGLTRSDLTLSKGTFVADSFKGHGCCYEVRVRPEVPASNSETITLTIAANSVTQGNPTTTKTIRISKVFPDADAEVPSLLFQLPSGNTYVSIAVTPQRIYLQRARSSLTILSDVHAFTHAGVEQSNEKLSYNRSTSDLKGLVFLNGNFLIPKTSNDVGLFEFGSGTLRELKSYPFPSSNGRFNYTRLGILRGNYGSHALLLPYDKTKSSDVIQKDGISIGKWAAHQGDLIYTAKNNQGWLSYQLLEDDTFRFIRNLNILLERQTGAYNYIFNDLCCFEDTFYICGYVSGRSSIYTLDIKKYRTLAKNTKVSIYPQFLSVGETLTLKRFAPDAERIVFDVGFSKPSFLSINGAQQLTVTGNATHQIRVVQVKCRAINRINSVAFSFYLVVVPALAPVWRDVSELTLLSGEGFDLFNIVSGATRIAVHPDFSLSAGNTLQNGILTMTVAQTLRFRAYNAAGQYSDSGSS